MALGHHIMLRLQDDRVIATDAVPRRRLARAVLHVGRDYRLLAFRASDTHIHIEAACSDADARRLAWRVELSLSKALALSARFRLHRIKPILDQGHLVATFRYLFRQEQHHGIDADPLFDASNLPDLLGWRVVGRYTIDHVRALLPRIGRSELLAHVGGSLLDDGEAALEDLPDAAAAAWALPSLDGRNAETVRARRAAIHAAVSMARAAAIADVLGVSRRAVNQQRTVPCPEHEIEAVRGQLRMRALHRLGARMAIAVDDARATAAHAPRPGTPRPDARQRLTGTL